MGQQGKQSLSGRIAVVTGGCGGIGTAVCARLAREGATVYATDLQGSDSVTSGEVMFHEQDVTSEDSAKSLMVHLDQQHGRLDILVNAAGVEIEQTIEETTLEEEPDFCDQRHRSLPHFKTRPTPDAYGWRWINNQFWLIRWFHR